MEQALEILKRKALPYAKEAFERHREQIFAAMQFMCLCSFAAKESGLLALDEVTEMFLGQGLAEEIFAYPSSFGGYQKIDTASFFR